MFRRGPHRAIGSVQTIKLVSIGYARESTAPFHSGQQWLGPGACYGPELCSRRSNRSKGKSLSSQNRAASRDAGWGSLEWAGAGASGATTGDGVGGVGVGAIGGALGIEAEAVGAVAIGDGALGVEAEAVAGAVGAVGVGDAAGFFIGASSVTWGSVGGGSRYGDGRVSVQLTRPPFPPE